MKGVPVMLLGLANNRQLKVRDEIVVAFQERQVHVDALAHDGIWKVCANAGPIRRVGQAPPELGQLMLGAGVLDVSSSCPRFRTRWTRRRRRSRVERMAAGYR
jgi:hypothetical protein